MLPWNPLGAPSMVVLGSLCPQHQDWTLLKNCIRYQWRLGLVLFLFQPIQTQGQKRLKLKQFAACSGLSRPRGAYSCSAFLYYFLQHWISREGSQVLVPESSTSAALSVSMWTCCICDVSHYSSQASWNLFSTCASHWSFSRLGWASLLCCPVVYRC